MKVVTLEALKNPYRASMRVPGRHKVAEIIKDVQLRIPEINTDHWRVYSCDNGREGPNVGTTLVCGIPESAVRALRARNFQVTWGLSKVRIRVGGEPTDQEKAEG